MDKLKKNMDARKKAFVALTLSEYRQLQNHHALQLMKATDEADHVVLCLCLSCVFYTLKSFVDEDQNKHEQSYTDDYRNDDT